MSICSIGEGEISEITFSGDGEGDGSGVEVWVGLGKMTFSSLRGIGTFSGFDKEVIGFAPGVSVAGGFLEKTSLQPEAARLKAVRKVKREPCLEGRFPTDTEAL